jgi:hypothetical protein
MGCLFSLGINAVSVLMFGDSTYRRCVMIHILTSRHNKSDDTTNTTCSFPVVFCDCSNNEVLIIVEHFGENLTSRKAIHLVVESSAAAPSQCHLPHGSLEPVGDVQNYTHKECLVGCMNYNGGNSLFPGIQHPLGNLHLM